MIKFKIMVFIVIIVTLLLFNELCVVCSHYKRSFTVVFIQIYFENNSKKKKQIIFLYNTKLMKETKEYREHVTK